MSVRDDGLPAEYSRLLTSIVSVIGDDPGLPDKFSVFWPMRGVKFTPGEGLLLVGRATNGWEQEWTTDYVKRPGGPAAIVAQARTNGIDGVSPHGHECPLSWVAESANDNGEYNTNRSAFWRVGRQVVTELRGDSVADTNWASNIAWSDLYKIAPYRNGNPTGVLQRVQRAGCVEMLRAEVEAWRPARVLLLTGIDWARPFIRGLGFDPDHRTEGEFVEASYVRENNGVRQCWVVAKHPQGKGEGGLVAEVLRAFSLLGSH